MSHTCPKCNCSFTTNRALNIHLANPPKRCIRAVQNNEEIQQDRNERAFSDDSYSLFDRYVKEGTRQLINKDPAANVYNFHEERNLCDQQTHQLLVRSKHEMNLLRQKHQADTLVASEKVNQYMSKYGHREEDRLYFNDCNESCVQVLEKQRECLLIKLAIIDTHLIQKGPHAQVIAALEKFFAADYIKRLS